MRKITYIPVGRLVKGMKRKQKDKFDSRILISGRMGLGKSTLGVKICSRFPQFKLKRDLVYSRDDVMQHLATKKEGVILADEMINVSFNRDFYAEDQKKLIKMLNMYRDSKNIFVMCVPNFASLDKQLLNLIQLRIDVIRRGFAVIHRPLQHQYSNDPWDIKNNEKFERNFTKKGLYKPRYEKLSTFSGYLKFGDLGVKQREIYEQVKSEKRGVVFDSQKEKTEHQQATNVADRLYQWAKEGKLSKKAVQLYCMMYDKKYSSVWRRLYDRARSEGLVMKNLIKDGDESELEANYHNVKKIKELVPT